MIHYDCGIMEATMHIRAVETQDEFSVYLNGSEQPLIMKPHDDDFPAFGDNGYDEETEVEDVEWDEVELVWAGCPDGYVVVVIKLKGRPVLCVLYGPDGFIASYGDVGPAINAAKAHDNNRPRSGGAGFEF